MTHLRAAAVRTLIEKELAISRDKESPIGWWTQMDSTQSPPILSGVVRKAAGMIPQNWANANSVGIALL